MMAVPDAAVFPIVARPIRCSNARMSGAGKPFGNVGNARSRTRPVSSQWPVTESLPADRSAIRPYAPSASGDGSPMAATRARPRRRSHGTASGTCLWMLPTVSLPLSP